MSTYHIVYKTINTINGKYYYGVHSTKDLNDGYLGSGTLLRQAILKHGAQNFQREIIEFFDTREDAFRYERVLVNEELVADSNCYNICVGGSGSVGTLVPSEETRRRMSESIKNRHAKFGSPNKGKKLGQRDPEIYQRIRQTKLQRGVTQATRIGTTHSVDTKSRMRKSALSRPRHPCVHCNKTVTIQTLARYHGDRCKSLIASNVHTPSDLL